jgi:hypothetical protein
MGTKKWSDYTEEQKEMYRAKAREYKANNKQKIKEQRKEYDVEYYKNLSEEQKKQRREYNCQLRAKQKSLKPPKQIKPLKEVLVKKSYSEIFVEKAVIKHDNKYDYSLIDYVNSSTKVSIICPIHGTFEQRPNDHLSGYGCPECGGTKRLTTDKFIEKAKELHGDRYDYSKVIYKTTIDKIIITCPIHGDFETKPNNHLTGKGCKQCGWDNGVWSYSQWEQKGLKSINFDSFKLYVIECWDNNERFFKIGKTFKSIKNRFRGKKLMPYNYKVIKLIEGDAKYISELELELKNNHKDKTYLPLNKFNGRYECFKSVSV